MGFIGGPMTEAESRARWDADTLAKAEEIKADGARLGAAVKAAGEMAREEEKEVQALRRVARKSGMINSEEGMPGNGMHDDEMNSEDMNGRTGRNGRSGRNNNPKMAGRKNGRKTKYQDKASKFRGHVRII